MKIVTHDGKFHTDDVFAAAILKNTFGVEIVRTRDPKIIESADIVFDVGGVYDPSIERYDHHMSVDQGAPMRDKNTRYSSVGLIWKYYHHEFINHCLGDTTSTNFQHIFCEIDKIISVIDAVDNGEYFVLQPINIFDVVSTLSHAHEFDLAVEMAYKYLRAKVIYEAERLRIRIKVDAAWDTRMSDEFLIFDDAEFDGEYIYYQYPSVLYIIQDKNDAGFRLSAISIPGSFNMRKALPKEWLDPLWFHNKGIKDMKFVHPNLFTSGFKNFETAIKMAQYAVKV